MIVCNVKKRNNYYNICFIYQYVWKRTNVKINNEIKKSAFKKKKNNFKRINKKKSQLAEDQEIKKLNVYFEFILRVIESFVPFEQS